MNIFIDSGPLWALVTPKDQWHSEAIRIIREISSKRLPLVTTDYVIDEVFTGLVGVKGTGYRRIHQLDLYVFRKGGITVEWISKERFFRTKALFVKVARDKKWSFTDCASFVVMKELGIKSVFTFDEHFRQMGLEVLDSKF